MRRAADRGRRWTCRSHRRRDDREQLAELLDRAHVAVLPYRFGTHSGWLELCRDRGTPVVAPSCGHFADAVGRTCVTYGHDERTGLDEESLRAAVAAASRPRPRPRRRSGGARAAAA